MMIPSPRARHGIFILLRRLRQPMLALIFVYAIAVLGFTLIPGVNPQGEPWKMSFLHAFYFVSFLGTTIGLGEIPFAFSDAQRLWATASIYGTVVAWLYAIGTLFNVLQDPLFRRIRHENKAERSVRKLKQPFYLLCGYDDAGNRVARELTEDGTRLVVVDADQLRVDAVDVDDLSIAVPALCGDASDPATMLLAGLTNGHCAGVLALTGDDFINTKIALTAHLLNPDVPILCAAHDHAYHGRMAAAGADYIINPNDQFAERVALTLRTPSLHVIYESLTTQSGTAMDKPTELPRGRWVLCGSDLFTRTLNRQLKRLEIETVVIDPRLPEGKEDEGHVRGDPNDADVLRDAGLEDAAAFVAGADTDVDNLSLTLAARAMNKSLFIIARQTQRRNTPLFRACSADLVTLSGYVIAAEVLRVIRAPQLATFLRRARDEDEVWASALLKRMHDVIGEEVVESWSIEISPSDAETACAALARGEKVTLRQLMIRTPGRSRLVHAVPLLFHRGQERELLPDVDVALQAGDRILFCGDAQARATMRLNLSDYTLPVLQTHGEAATVAAPEAAQR